MTASSASTRTYDSIGNDSPSAPYIKIRGLRKSFAGSAAIDSLDLDVAKGELLVLLGPSGCGKSTTMRSIVGLETPDLGSIIVDGQYVFDSVQAINVPPNKRGMGMVFQSYALWPHKSVYGNVAFPLQMRRTPKKAVREAVSEALETVGLPGFEKRSVTTLSGGQMQRIALARSLVMRPKILLLDEPLSNLDARLRVHLRHELKEIQQRTGLTSIYVTHDLDEALGLADRIVVMHNGRIAQQGSPEQIYSRPNTPFVADFLGMSNCFAGDVAGTAGGQATIRLRGADIAVLCLDGRTDTGTATGTLCVRPDAVFVKPAASSPLGASSNQFAGSVLSRQYQGSRLRYHVALDAGPNLFVDAPEGGQRLEPGRPCTVKIDSLRALFLQEPEIESTDARLAKI